MDEDTAQAFDSSSYLKHGDLINFRIHLVESENQYGFLCVEDNLHFESDQVKHVTSLVVSEYSLKDAYSCNLKICMDGVFEIVSGVGHESPGEPVQYGAIIKLKLKRSSCILSATRENATPKLVDPEDPSMISKNFSFRIRSKYKIRSDGEKVYFNDIVVLKDSFGRSISHSMGMDVFLGEDHSHFCSFRLLPFVQYSPKASNNLIGSSFIKLLHKEEQKFLSFSTFDKSAPESAEPHPHASTADVQKIDSCFDIWQIEVLNSLENQVTDSFLTSLSFNGVVKQNTHVRIRHVISNMYLSAVDNEESEISELVLKPIPDEFCLFNFNFSLNSVFERDASNPITEHSTVQLINSNSMDNVILNSSYQFCLSSEQKNYKDVFQIKFVSLESIDEIIFARILKAALSIILQRIEGLSSITFSNIIDVQNDIDKAILLLKKIHQSNVISDVLVFESEHFNDQPPSDLISRKQNTYLENNFVALILQLAECGIKFSSNTREDGKYNGRKGFDLAYTAYMTIGLLVKDNIEIARIFVQNRGIQRMISHFKFGEIYRWNNILVTIATTFLSRMNGEINQLINKIEINSILEFARNTLMNQDIPSKHIIDFLNVICVNCNDNFENIELQEYICESLVGTSVNKSGSLSLFLYLCFQSDQSEEVMVYVSHFGKSAPLSAKATSTLSNHANTIFSNFLSGVPEADYALEYTKVSSALQKVLGDIVFLKSPCSRDGILAAALQLLGDSSRINYSALLEHILSKYFKSLSTLSTHEAEYLCSMINLLSSLCRNRNIFSQSSIRDFFPVDVILSTIRFALNSASSPGTHNLMYSISSTLQDLLNNCYVNSGFLPPLPATGFESRMVGKTLSGQVGSFQDVYNTECRMKVFGFNSQFSEDLLIISSNLTQADIVSQINKCKEFMQRNGTYFNFSPFPEGLEHVLVDGSGYSISPAHREKITQFFLAHQKERLRFYREKNFESIRQRKKLYQIIKDIFDKELIGTFSSIVFSFQSIFQDDAFSAALNRNYSNKKITFETLNSLAVLARSSLRLVKSLLLRRFFDDSYNTNPKFTLDDSSSNERTPQYSKPEYFYEQQEAHTMSGVNLAYIARCLLMMLEAVPLIDISYFIKSHDDEKKLMQEFQQKYGYLLNDKLSHEITQVLSCCCECFSITMDLIQINTIEYIQPLLIADTDGSKEEANESDVVINFDSGPLMNRNRLVHQFENLVNSATLGNLKIWDFEKISAQYFYSILNLIYYNDDKLKSIAMNIIFRSANLFEEFQEVMRSEYLFLREVKTHHRKYLENQKQNLLLAMSQLFLSFRLLDVIEKNYDYSTKSEFDFKKLFHASVNQFLFIIKNNQAVFGQVGLINFCYLTDYQFKNNQFEMAGGANYEFGTQTILKSIDETYEVDNRNVNRYHQDLLHRFEFHTAVFHLMQQIYEITTNSNINFDVDDFLDPYSSVNSLSYAYILESQPKIISACIHFLRAFIANNQFNADQIASREKISLIIKLNTYSSESEELLREILLLSNRAKQLITIDDIKSLFIKLTPSFHSIQSGYQVGSSSINSILQAFSITSEILQNTQSGEFIGQIVQSINHLTKTGIINDILKYALYPPNSQKVDPKVLCKLYEKATGRLTFARDPIDVLKDNQVDESFVAKVMTVVSKWALLPPNSFLLVSLRCVGFISLVMKKIDNFDELFLDNLSCHSILRVLMIDKHEIRFSFMKLLQSHLFVGSKLNIGFFAQMFSDTNKMFTFALFFSFLQDIRVLFYTLKLKQSDAVESQRELEPNEKLIRSYVFRSILPFMSSFYELGCLNILETMGVDLYLKHVQPDQSIILHSFSEILSGILHLLNQFRVEIENLPKLKDGVLALDLIGSILSLSSFVTDEIKQKEHIIVDTKQQKEKLSTAQHLNELYAIIRNFTQSKHSADEESSSFFSKILKPKIGDAQIYAAGPSKYVFDSKRQSWKDSSSDRATCFLFEMIKVYGCEFQDMEWPAADSKNKGMFDSIAKLSLSFVEYAGLTMDQFDFNQFWGDLKKSWTKQETQLIKILFNHIQVLLRSSEVYRSKTLQQAVIFWLKISNNILQDAIQGASDESGSSDGKERLTFLQNCMIDIGLGKVIIRIISSVSHFQDAHETDVLLELHKFGVFCGISSLELGNKYVQDILIDMITSELSLEFVGSARFFLPSLRLMIQRVLPAITSNEASQMNNAVEEIDNIMRFITLLCEGHNEKAQLFLLKQDGFWTTNIVAEVAVFAQEVIHSMTDIIRQMFYSNNENSKVRWRPQIFNNKREIVDWSHPKASALISYGRILFATFEALSEMIQGPCEENQYSIARSGILTELSVLFDFFGAIQLETGYEDQSQYFRLNNHEWRSNFSKVINYYVSTSDRIIKADSSRLFWFGNDPLMIELMVKFKIGEESEVVHSVHQKNNFFNLRYSTASKANLSPSLSNSLDGEEGVPIPKSPVLRNKYNLVSKYKLNRAEYLKTIQRNNSSNGSTEGNGLDSSRGNIYFLIRDVCEHMGILEQSCLKLLGSLLEGSKMEQNEEVPKIISSSIKNYNLLSNLINYWERYLRISNQRLDNILEEKDYHDCFEFKMSFDYYSLVMRLCDLNFPFIYDLRDNITKWIEERKIPIHENIARIELQGQESRSINVVYFPIPLVVRKYWRRPEIENFRQSILFPSIPGKRDSVEEKLMSFMEEGKNLMHFLWHIDALDKSARRNLYYIPIVNIAKNLSFWSWITFLLTMAINLLLLSNPDSFRSKNSNQDYEHVMRYLGTLLVASCCTTVFSYSVMYGIHYIRLGRLRNPKNELTVSSYFGKLIVSVLFFIGVAGKTMKTIEKSIVISPGRDAMIFVYFLGQQEIYYYSTLLFASILGLTISPMFFSICLIEVLRVSKPMQYVTRSFTLNIGNLLATIFLGAVIIYLFVMIKFASSSLRNAYNINGHIGCETLNACFRLHLDYVITNSISWNDDGYIQNAGGEIFNFMLIFIIQIVLPGIVSGIIIDTFASQRQSTEDMMQDVNNTCFICNIGREDFETADLSFAAHIQRDHNMWAYLWYTLYLKQRKHTDFTGVEQFCFEQISSDNYLRWLPVKMARSLRKLRDKYDLFTIYSKISSLKTQIEKIDSSLSKLHNYQESLSRTILKQQHEYFQQQQLQQPPPPPPPQQSTATQQALPPSVTIQQTTALAQQQQPLSGQLMQLPHNLSVLQLPGVAGGGLAADGQTGQPPKVGVARSRRRKLSTLHSPLHERLSSSKKTLSVIRSISHTKSLKLNK